MLDSEIKINRFLIQYCRMLLEDVPEERMAEQPLPGVNHPAWILGHLAYSANAAVGLLGGEKTLPRKWIVQFGPGSKLSGSREDYPASGELLQAIEQGFARAHELASVASPEQLSQPNPNARLAQALRTVGDAVGFLFTGHMGVHLGQLSSWRRMIGLAALF